MAEIIAAIAALLSGVAAVIAALKASDAASSAADIKQSMSALQAQMQNVEQSVKLSQGQTQTVFTGPVSYTGPVYQVSGGIAQPEVAAATELPKTPLADETEVRWPQLPQQAEQPVDHPPTAEE